MIKQKRTYKKRAIKPLSHKDNEIINDIKFLYLPGHKTLKEISEMHGIYKANGIRKYVNMAINQLKQGTLNII